MSTCAAGRFRRQPRPRSDVSTDNAGVAIAPRYSRVWKAPAHPAVPFRALRTRAQNIAGDGYQGDPIDGYARGSTDTFAQLAAWPALVVAQPARPTVFLCSGTAGLNVRTCRGQGLLTVLGAEPHRMSVSFEHTTQNSFPSGSASTVQDSAPVWPMSTWRAPSVRRRSISWSRSAALVVRSRCTRFLTVLDQ